MEFQEYIYNFFTKLLGETPNLQIEDTNDSLNIELSLDPDKSGIIIGYHGEVLSAAQLILSLSLQQQTGVWKPVRINVNDYRQKRQQALETLAADTATRVIKTGSPLTIRNLSSFERRIVHSALSNFTGVTTHSEGNPPHRVLIVSPAESIPDEA